MVELRHNLGHPTPGPSFCLLRHAVSVSPCQREPSLLPKRVLFSWPGEDQRDLQTTRGTSPDSTSPQHFQSSGSLATTAHRLPLWPGQATELSLPICGQPRLKNITSKEDRGARSIYWFPPPIVSCWKLVEAAVQPPSKHKPALVTRLHACRASIPIYPCPSDWAFWKEIGRRPVIGLMHYTVSQRVSI